MSDLLAPPPFDQERDDWGALLLREWAESTFQAGQRVLIVGAGAGGVGVPLARAGVQVTFVDDSVSALAAAEAACRRARTSAEFRTTREFAPAQPYDAALLNIIWWAAAERGHELLALAAQHVRPNGLIIVGGGKNAGIRSVEDALATLVGPVSALVYKKGHRIIATERPAEWQAPRATYATSSVAIGEHTFELLQRPGVFAEGGLDAASAMLIEALQVPAGARVLDLGCGSGILAMAAARQQPDCVLTLVDSNVLAVATAEQNLAANAISGRVLAADGTAGVADEQFDLIVCNPPFHVGRLRTEKIALSLFEQAAGVCAPDGQFVIVANRFLRYEPALSEHWGQVREIAGDERFKVLAAREPR